MTADNYARSTTPAQAETPRSCGTRVRPYYQSTPFQAAMMRAGVSRSAQCLFQEIVRRSGRRGYTWALQGDLATYFGVTDRTIRRWEASLSKAGLLTLGRVSFWARRRKGGVRRVAIPHTYDGEAFACPRGILDDAKHLLCDGRRVRAGAIKARRTMRRGLSGTGARLTLFTSRQRKDDHSSSLGSQTQTGNQGRRWPEDKTEASWKQTLAAYLGGVHGWIRDQGQEFAETWGWTLEDVMGPGWVMPKATA